MLRFRFLLPVLAAGFVLLSTSPTRAQSQAQNDGFQRQDGTMYVIRNGAKRPMTQDVHLPNGRVVTRDGFVITRDGTRTELAEGKGCDLSGSVVAVAPGPNGQLRLAAASRTQTAAASTAVGTAYLRQLFAGPGKHKGWGRFKKGKHGKGKGKKHDD
ncbi:hypothetical protein E5K00_14945 [Hymenobacter aquaticus]|uniref:DUF6799 domain-containing protein n=1 Tax=Hymenobacter aquaticus TaxID=1867101 RepID=A0A4Z0PVQ4_9BACT|nr:DUF6799 domain-containing protein [Hymenobacter aquaticus]TGE21575.1 hypothetical protein E5K00_14945 [Hymenobacter aquaticus]